MANKLRYTVNVTDVNQTNPEKKKNQRKIPLQILVVFLFLIGLGVSIHCFTSFIYSFYYPSGLQSTTGLKHDHTVKNLSVPDSWTDSNLLNITTFRWIRNNLSICENIPRKDVNSNSNLLLILVNSARENYNDRSSIRKAVQRMTETIKNTEWTVRLVFLLGAAYDPINSGEKDAWEMEEAFLDEEFSVFGDIITGSFLDTYENLTYKTTMGLKWALTFCSDATFIVKMYDDAFFNIPRFVEWRDLETKNAEGNAKAPDLYCILETGKRPLREANEKSFGALKYLVSESEWPESEFPDYCKGLMYGMSMDLAMKTYDMARSSKYFRMEDIFFTGVVMNQVRAKYGPISTRQVDIGTESEHTIRTICDPKILRQTVSQELGLVLQLERSSNMEKQMLCLADDA